VIVRYREGHQAVERPLAELELQEALCRLVEAGLVFQRGAPPAAEYLFKRSRARAKASSGVAASIPVLAYSASV
jgi:hypothetical protein